MVRFLKLALVASSAFVVVSALLALRAVPMDEDANTAIARFAASRPALRTLDLTRWSDGEHSAVLLDPTANFPSTFRFPRAALRTLVHYAETCVGNVARAPAVLEKAWQWHRFRCGTVSRLPVGFFSQPPYLHPGGASFVRLAMLAGGQFDRAWLKEYFPYLAVGELGTLGNFALPSPYRELAGLPADVREGLSRKSSVVVGSDGVYIGVVGNRYAHYPLATWTEFQRDRAGMPEARAARIAWGKRAAGAGILAAILFCLLVFLRRRAQTNSRRLMLQVLTHELRTPVTSLNLVLDKFRARYDDLPGTLQDSFLQFCDEVTRLKQLIRASTQYLSAKHEGEFRFQWRALSLAALFEELGEEYSGRVAIEIPPAALSLETDPYWLKACLTNLLENALRHGDAPVSLHAYVKRDRVTLEVQDGGRLLETFTLAHPTRGAAESRGLGWGLDIVQRILRQLGGDLSFARNPTVFRICFARRPQ